ncbi:pentatricopeptide repeat-containing protein At2g06000 [Dioscorea cayenensis subsp. rotundata]|uniref:Pentatricopeptide repeat-containing protein At2g06000 n=1 Tax=Dioscorea cayennensis subsp. rotundata TaxID=55577 RepID=A0AB40CXW8_DIOCR|nr:pentatricopeptide repeat-containing protein At2g06000 [Dioscorea cayenensis subsp. rotundata]
MLLRGAPYLNVHRLLLPARRHLASGCATTDLWISKALATLFVVSPSPPALYLSSFSQVLDASIAFSALRRLSDSESAVNLFRTTQSTLKVSHFAASYRVLISILCCAGRLSDALNLFDEMTEKSLSFDGSFLGFLVDSCADSGHLDSALRLVCRASADFQFCLRAYHVNNLMNRLVAANRAKDAIFLFEEQLSSQGFNPDTCSFNVVIKGLCLLGDVDRAFEIYKKMASFGCVPDTFTHNSLVVGLCRANRIDGGREFLRRIQVDGLFLPNVITYTSLISGYCKLGRMKDALEVFDEMLSLEIKPSRITYNVLIDGYGKVCDMQSANSMYDRMILGGCQPDIVTFTSLIDGYCRCGLISDAMKLWHELVERELQPNAYTFAVVIIAFCKMNRLSEARELLNELNRRKDIVPRAFIYNPVIDGLCKAGKVDEANMTLMEMERKGCSPDKFTYTILIIGHCMKGRMVEAIQLFDRMVTSGCTPDHVTFGSLTSCLLKAAMPDEANRVMLMRERKIGLGCINSETGPSCLKPALSVSVAS